MLSSPGHLFAIPKTLLREPSDGVACYDPVSCVRFLSAACTAIRDDVERRAVREVIQRTMEKYKLIYRTRGGEPLGAHEPEDFS